MSLPSLITINHKQIKAKSLSLKKNHEAAIDCGRFGGNIVKAASQRTPEIQICIETMAFDNLHPSLCAAASQEINFQP